MQTGRRPIIAGNWKMYTTPPEGRALAQAIRARAEPLAQVDLVLCPPFTSLAVVAECLQGSPIGLGAQNMHWELEGALTGEVSAKMLLTVGCHYVILGHSERRTCFGETDAMVHQKVLTALAVGLTPIVCVGETLVQREAGQTEAVVYTQVRSAFADIPSADLGRVILAYEPVWAIGTGRVATPVQANDVHRRIRALLAELADDTTAARVRIQYGGSVKPENAAALLAEPDIDGALVGGASLKVETFLEIVRAAVS
ncbi:MAG: triose-phosphate isomerase [Candidatus Latescibacteria bacterium]|nr:triose-phosphate isomerase [Candidatus Latescibacterota bacterium]